MNDAVYYGTLPDVTPVIQAFSREDNTFMILEKLPTGWIDDADRLPPDNGLIFETFDRNKEFNEWGRGRIFNPVAELRWEQIIDGFQMIYIGQPVELPGLTQDNTLRLTQSGQKQDKHYYLWGQRMSPSQLKDINWPDKTATDIFVELKTPRVLRYPVQVKAGSRLKLQVVEYYDQVTGHLSMYRFKGVEAA